MNVRQPGAIGSTDSARVFKGLRMAGQMGNVRTTARAYKVVRVDAERNLILLNGGVPGARGALVLVRQSTKPMKVKGPAGKPTGRKV
jgi:large subunit ribosomal protein L3